MLDFQQIVALIQSGQWSQAKVHCLGLCARSAQDVQAWNLLALVHSQFGEIEGVISCCRQVIALQPENAAAYYNLGVALQHLRNFDGAETAYRHTLRIDPDHAGGCTNLAFLLCEMHRYKEAESICRHVLTKHTALTGMWNNLGLALRHQDKTDEAAECFERVLQFDSTLASAFYNLGLCRVLQKRLADAEACFQNALRRQPDYAEALHDLGNVLRACGKYDQAYADCRRAMEISPRLLGAHNTLGLVCCDMGRYEEAVEWFQTETRVNPDYVYTYNNLGNALSHEGRYSEALASYQHALALDPDYASAHWNMACLLLLIGDFERGWQEYEWRWKNGVSTPRHFAQPRWNGLALHGHSILLYAEQGAGDSIQFIRYVGLLKLLGGRVIVESPPALSRLFATSPDIDLVVPAGEALPHFDVHVPILSLPGILHTELASIPADVPYLHAPKTINEGLEQALADPADGFRIGIVWSGNVVFPLNRFRSCRLKDFAVLAAISGVTLYSLQKGPPATELSDWQGRQPLIDLGAVSRDYADTAAAIASLDLIITVDTSVAHLAGALGRPVWVLLQFSPDWRWLCDREDSPWYPSMRLFRQASPGDWRGVFEKLVEELAQWMIGRRGQAEAGLAGLYLEDGANEGDFHPNNIAGT